MSVVKRPNKNVIRKIVEIQPTEEIDTLREDKEFVTITIEVDKGKELDKIPKKLVSQPLFEHRSDTVEITKTRIEFEGATIYFKRPAVFAVTI